MNTAVSTSTTMRSPGDTFLVPPARARIFSVIVMPMGRSPDAFATFYNGLLSLAHPSFAEASNLCWNGVGRTRMNRETGLANPYTAGMARFVAGLRYDAIPAEV